MNKQETVGDHISRFMEVVDEYEALDDSKELAQEELTNLFLNNASPVIPAIQHQWTGHIVKNGKQMNFLKLHDTLLLLEAQKRWMKEELAQSTAPQPKTNPTKQQPYKPSRPQHQQENTKQTPGEKQRRTTHILSQEW